MADELIVYRHADGRDLAELCDNIRKYREQGIAYIRCQSGGYGGGGYGEAPAAAPSGAPDGVYLDSRKYMRDTIALFEGIRSQIGWDVQLCHDVHERLKPIEAIKFAWGLVTGDQADGGGRAATRRRQHGGERQPDWARVQLHLPFPPQGGERHRHHQRAGCQLHDGSLQRTRRADHRHGHGRRCAGVGALYAPCQRWRRGDHRLHGDFRS